MKNHADTAIELSACFQNPQNILAEAVQKEDLDSFRAALRIGASPGLVDPKTHMSIFEKICRMPNFGAFIELCLPFVDVNEVNDHFNKAPVNLVAETKNYNNLKALLSVSGLDVNRMANGMTPLFKLINSLTPENSDEITMCIKLLINYGADVNIPNQQNITPIIALLKKTQKLSDPESLVQLLLNHPRIDLDTHRKGEARELLTKSFPHLQQPGPNAVPVTYEKLRQMLKNEMEELFLEQIQKVDAKDVLDAGRQSQDDNLLIAATENGLHRALSALVPLCDVNAGGRKCPLKVACQRGEWRILEELLKCETINLSFNKTDPLLCIVVKKLGEKGLSNRCDYFKCFQYLIDDPRIDVNEVDNTGSSALHYAVKYKNETAIKQLLQKSAYIGLQNRFRDIPIVDIDVNVLRKHLDNCITPNSLRPGDTNYQIHFDYSNLNSDAKGNTATFSEEMVPISYIAKNTELRSLLKHPLLSSYLFLKWNRLAPFFYANLLLYTLFSVALITYVTFCYGRDSDWGVIVWGISILGGLYVLLREIFQLVTAPKVYFLSLENWFEILLIILTGLVLSDFSMNGEENRRIVAAILILVISLEFAILVGALPILSFSTHMTMLKTVFQSLLRSLAFYSILIVSFSLCFYTLLGVESESADNSTVTPSPGNVCCEDDKGTFNKFVNPGQSLIKTIVMMTGEYEAADLNLGSPANYSIFLLFVIFISIVLFNLLNGLAVSDTQKIKEEAELVGLIGRAELLARFEKIIVRDSNFCNSFFDRVCKKRISLFPEFLPGSQIKLLPNLSNRIVIPTKKDVVVELFKGSRARSHSEENLMSSSDIERAADENYEASHMCCLLMERCSRMDGGIAKQAHAVLARKQDDLEAEAEKKMLSKRISKIEEQLTQIIGGLYEMNRIVGQQKQ